MEKTKWTVDSTHSELGFRVKHLMITNVAGTFGEYQIDVSTNKEDFSSAQIYVKIESASVNTNNMQRDQHLRTEDFFDVNKFPDIIFTSNQIEPAGNHEFFLTGLLTLKGVSKPVKFDVEYTGITTDPWGSRRAGFVITGKINRNEFGLNFNSVLDSGGLALAENVNIHCEIQLVKQKENAVEIAA